MRIPAIKSDFKADICHAIGQKKAIIDRET